MPSYQAFRFSGIEATAHRIGDGGGFRINGEKWFVTSGDVCSVLVVMANLIEDGESLPTLFVVDRELPGIDYVDDPAFTHSYPDGHPTIVFRDVEVDAKVGERLLVEVEARVPEGDHEAAVDVEAVAQRAVEVG